jgi:hypothetical protein
MAQARNSRALLLIGGMAMGAGHKPLDCFTSFAMTAFWISITATRLQLRAKRGRGEADAAIQDTSSLRGGEADVAIQVI